MGKRNEQLEVEERIRRPRTRELIRFDLLSHRFSEASNLERSRAEETRILDEFDRIYSRIRIRFRFVESGTRYGWPYPESGCYVRDISAEPERSEIVMPRFSRLFLNINSSVGCRR